MENKTEKFIKSMKSYLRPEYMWTDLDELYDETKQIYEST